MKTSIAHFSDRVADYIKYRPKYPPQIIDILQSELGLNDEFVIADIGSGTGTSSELFLKNSNRVFAVEPNDEMRTAAESLFTDNTNFISINGRAENTNLEQASIDLIFCGQSFHWFDKQAAKSEFDRILKPGGSLAFAWNQRDDSGNFHRGYEQILQENIHEYRNNRHRNPEEEIKAFFAPKKMYKTHLTNSQTFDLQGLKGRLQSSSYCPKSGEEHENLMKKIEDLFHKFAIGNTIQFDYITNIYWCK